MYNKAKNTAKLIEELKAKNNKRILSLKYRAKKIADTVINIYPQRTEEIIYAISYDYFLSNDLVNDINITFDFKNDMVEVSSYSFKNRQYEVLFYFPVSLIEKGGN